MYQALEPNRLKVEDLPEIDTEVAIASSTKQQEIGGGVCLALVAGIAVYAGW